MAFRSGEDCCTRPKPKEVDSAYLRSLTNIDRLQYLKKLTLTTGKQLPDPYSLPAPEWVNDASKWPSIQWPDIYLYLIEKPSVYTKEKLRAYRSLDAFEFVQHGHVQAVKYHGISDNSEFCVLKADVLPSQRQGLKTNFYKAWIVVHKLQAFILTANCTCVAG